MARHAHTDFEKAFTEGLRFNERGGLGDVLHVLRPGVLDVPSGRLVACDPLGADAGAPVFLRHVTPGRYPVLLSRWTSEALRDERIAAAKLVLAERPAVTWELALREGEEGRPQRRRKDATFPVDSGNACFLDAERARQRLAEDEAVREAWLDAGPPGLEGAFVVGEPSAAEVIGFGAGLGDGRYRSWWGLDAAGEPVALVTDFDLLYVREWEDLYFPLGGLGPLEHPRLEKLGLRCELLDVWESRRIDASTAVSVRYSGADLGRIARAEWAVVDASGAPLPTRMAEHHEELFGRWGRLRRLQAAAPFPPGARLRLSWNTGSRPL